KLAITAATRCGCSVLPAAPRATNSQENRMDETVRKISADDINPRYNWGRALPALGIMGVDFEERVDYRRLHRYRLSRVRHAEEIASLIKEAGCDKMPVGIDIIEPPMMFELQKAGLNVVDGQQVMLEAREIKNIDEIALLNRAAAMVDGAYHLINEELKPGVRENDIVGKVNEFLYRHGSDDVEAINAISGERCNPHPHNFTDRML